MPVRSQEAEENRFILLVTWRREKQTSDFEGSVWRGFVRQIRRDGSMETPLWFQRLDDLGGIVKHLLPAYAFSQDPHPNQHPNPED